MEWLSNLKMEDDMSIFSSIPLVGKIIDKSFDLIDEVVEDKDEANKLKAALEDKWRDVDLTKFVEQIKAQASVIIAEAQGSWLQKNWRPMTMLMFGFIIFNNYVLHPYLSLFWANAPVLETPPDLWALIKIGLGGYVAGRSGEKIAKVWKGRGRRERE